MSASSGPGHSVVILLLDWRQPNQIWRMLGLCSVGGIDEKGSELMVGCGLCRRPLLARRDSARIWLQPQGALASVPG